MNNDNYDVDFVIPWVDGADSAWRSEKSKYTPGRASDARDCHYRDWNNLRYWFRAVEQFAPWVHKVHFVTWGHLPRWLNLDNPKLHVVRHEDYIPDNYLPVFSANPIELNFHRIKGLAEHFVYFNDDMFITKDVSPSDFFKNGLPCDTAALSVHCYSLSKPIQMMSVMDTGVINEHFDFHEVIKSNWKKWFRLGYGSVLLRTFALLGSPRFPGFYVGHLPNSYLKSTFEEVWKQEPLVLEETCSHRFRMPTDVNQWVMKEWQIASGDFVPRSTGFGKVFFLDKDGLSVVSKITDAITKQKYKVICINDGEMDAADFERISNQVNHSFESILGKKSSFEL